MDTITQANQLRGFVESLKLSDNVTKAQLEMLLTKIDLLIKTIDDDIWDEASRTVSDSLNIKPNKNFIEDEHDDLPF